MKKYEIGDIVWVKELNDKNEERVNNHLFVVIDDDGKIVPMEYFGFVVSSNLSKSKTNSKFRYNEPISKNEKNKLNSDSIVKCDQLFNTPKYNINYKIGTVDTEDLMRFLQAYNNYLNEKKD